jgi:hypothetical protein
MKKICLLFLIIFTSNIVKSQESLSRGMSSDNVQVSIDGYKVNDTIKLDDFLRLSELSLNNKDYSISSYRFSYTKHGLTSEIFAKSNQFSDTIIYNLMKEKDDKKYYSILQVHIDNIKLKSKDGSKKVAESLTFFIKK